MESLKIRITLTNTKGWKETQVVSLTHYLEEKEKGKNIVDETIQRLTNDFKNMKEKTTKNKKEEWRP